MGGIIRSMIEEIDLIVDTCDKLKDKIGCDEFKFYYINNRDYCFKFIEKGKIVQVIRRGVRRR